jgi:hypothetical protein
MLTVAGVKVFPMCIATVLCETAVYLFRKFKRILFISVYSSKCENLVALGKLYGTGQN